ncbi:MAG: helix-turn-helix domain-containing protein [Patulibacter sp.]|nr:helix-turn-helix domain-containing protein [Patulibacter sp.]
MSTDRWPYDPKVPSWPPPGAGPGGEVAWRTAASTAPELTAEDVMSVAETAALLGCSKRHVYDLVGRDELPGARYLGRTVIVVRPVLVDWLLTGERPTAS